MNDKLFVISGPNLFLMCTCLTIYHGLMVVSASLLKAKKKQLDIFIYADIQLKNMNRKLILLLPWWGDQWPQSIHIFDWVQEQYLVFSDIFFDWWAEQYLQNCWISNLNSNESCEMWKIKKLHTENM